MPTHSSLFSPDSPDSPAPAAASIVLNLARRLHKEARADSPLCSLPVLRRLLATAVFRDLSLTDLYQQRGIVQRKHVLRMLAIEVGFSSWEDYRPALNGMSAAQLQHYDVLRVSAGGPNQWFSSTAQAKQHADSHGGRVVQVGQQAVVI